jgi:hypothetical protein
MNVTTLAAEMPRSTWLQARTSQMRPRGAHARSRPGQRPTVTEGALPQPQRTRRTTVRTPSGTSGPAELTADARRPTRQVSGIARPEHAVRTQVGQRAIPTTSRRALPHHLKGARASTLSIPSRAPLTRRGRAGRSTGQHEGPRLQETSSHDHLDIFRSLNDTRTTQKDRRRPAFVIGKVRGHHIYQQPTETAVQESGARRPEIQPIRTCHRRSSSPTSIATSTATDDCEHPRTCPKMRPRPWTARR